MTYTHLLTNKDTGEQQLVEASSPSIAIAEAAAETFTAERLRGGALALLAKSMPVRKAGVRAAPTPEPGPGVPPCADPPATSEDKKTAK